MDLGFASGSQNYPRVSAREGEMIKYRDMHTVLTFNLLNGDKVEGVVRWYDYMSVGILTGDKVDVTLFFNAISYYQPKKIAE